MIISQPGLAALTFYTDAAGASFTVVGGKRCYHDNDGKGAACIGGTSLEDIWGWTRLSWPDGLLTKQRDEKGCYFGSKSNTLECIGVLLPFLTYPEKLRNKQLVFRVDNTAIMWGWNSGYVSNNATATEVLKCVRYLAGFLGARVFIEHVDRMSTEMASLADEMSRRDTSRSVGGWEALCRAEFRVVRGFLLVVDPPRGRFSPSLLRPTSHPYPPPYTPPADQQETGPPYFYLTPPPRSQGVQ